jgi:hypothetical protein
MYLLNLHSQPMSFHELCDDKSGDRITFLRDSYNRCLCTFGGRLYRFQYVPSWWFDFYYVYVVKAEQPNPITKSDWETDKYSTLYNYPRYNVMTPYHKKIGSLNPFVQTNIQGNRINLWGNVAVIKLQRWWRRVYITPKCRLAIHMATHPILGAKSLLKDLPLDLLKKIAMN